MTEEKTYIGFKAIDMGFDAHMTMLYTGPLNEEQVVYAEAFLLDIASYNTWVARKGLALFGEPKELVDVLLVDVDKDLQEFRRKLELSALPNPSQYAWNPHITLDFEGMHTVRIPPMIKLTSLGLY